MGRHRKATEKLCEDLTELTNKAIKDALKAGMETAVLATHQDSSNAAAHWIIVPIGERPRSPWFTARDLRAGGNAKRRKVIKHRLFKKAGDGVVGAVGEDRTYSKPEMTKKVASYVKEREVREVLDRVLVGRKTAVRKYMLYNAIQENNLGKTIDGNSEAYIRNANLDKAGKQAKLMILTKAFEYLISRSKNSVVLKRMFK